MKILIVDQLSQKSGKDNVMLGSSLRKAGANVILFFSDTFDGPTNNLNIIYGFKRAYIGNIFQKGFHYIQSWRRLLKYIKKNSFDVVLFQWFSIPWIERFLVKKVKRESKIISLVHEVKPFKPRIGEVHALKKVYQEMDAVLIQNDYSLKEFNSLYSIKTPIYKISQAFCNKEDFEQVTKNEARHRLQIPEDSFVFLFFGTIRESKGLDILISSFAKVASQKPKAFLLIGGACDKTNSSYYQSLLKKVPGKYQAIFDFISAKDEKYFFSAADVLCLPYKSIYQSGVAQVGLMYDLPIIAFNVGSMTEIVTSGINGELVAQINDEAYAQAMVKLMNADLTPYITNARKIGITKFSLDKKAQEMLTIFSKVCQK